MWSNRQVTKLYIIIITYVFMDYRRVSQFTLIYLHSPISKVQALSFKPKNLYAPFDLYYTGYNSNY